MKEAQIQHPEGAVGKETLGPEAVKTRVLGFFEGANPAIADGSKQQIGQFQVRIQTKPWEKNGTRTQYGAFSNGLELALRTVDTDASGRTTLDFYHLNGAIDGEKAHLYVIERPDQPQSARAFLPTDNPSQTRDMDRQLLTDLDRAQIYLAFGIEF